MELRRRGLYTLDGRRNQHDILRVYIENGHRAVEVCVHNETKTVPIILRESHRYSKCYSSYTETKTTSEKLWVITTIERKTEFSIDRAVARKVVALVWEHFVLSTHFNSDRTYYDYVLFRTQQPHSEEERKFQCSLQDLTIR